MDPGNVAVGLALISLAFSVISLTRRPSSEKPISSKSDVTCPCGHGINYHDELKGRCHEVELTPIGWGEYGRPNKFREDPCTCQVYAGPELLRSLTDLGISLPPAQRKPEDQ